MVNGKNRGFGNGNLLVNISNPNKAFKDLFKINIISDGSEHGYYLRLNNQVNNTHIFCGTKFL